MIDAVLALKPARIDLVPAKPAAVEAFRARPRPRPLAANKRIVNILRKAEGTPGEPDLALLQEDAEKALFHQVVEVAPLVRSHVADEDYTDALCALAGLRAAVDQFFEDVMVMAEEPLTRANRPRAAGPARRPDEPGGGHLAPVGLIAVTPRRTAPRASPRKEPVMKLIVLDRDGVINVDRGSTSSRPRSGSVPIPGALEAIARLKPVGLAGGGGDQPVRHRPRPVRHGHAQRDQRPHGHLARPGGRAA